MALSGSLTVCLVLSMLVLSSLVESRAVLESQQISSGGTGGSLLGQAAPINCKGACQVRCSKTSRPHLCQRACGTCCGRCSCVPPGTSGNYEICPCYAAITTRGGHPKCP